MTSLVPVNPTTRSPVRMGELAVLPVFLDLRGKRVVAVGGSEAACWKIELLAAAGARVDVYALKLCPELSDLIDSSPLRRGGASKDHCTTSHPNPPPQGGREPGIVLHQREWAAEDLFGAAFAVADIDDEGEAELFVQKARAAGVPYNVIDKPEFCQVQFGSIVNRSPLVVGISTAGAAPVLGQAVRRRIETALPRTLSLWARLAAEIRPRVMERLPAGPRRRAFWEQLADRAFGTAPPEARDSNVEHFALVPRSGRVTLVGAGPGDADLLTIKAVRALQSADIILFDDLVSAEVLEMARREARRMLVGKRAGRDSCRQEDINQTMLSLARQGKHVVRLKSGDPMIFGRAGEEIAMLEEHGIPVTVVPGITSALALASSLGASLTHRDCAQSVRFVTGHSRKGALPENLDWRALADPATTNIFYMSRRTLPAIVEQLAAHGLTLSTPAVIASNVSRPGQTVWRGSLADAVRAAEDFDLSAPTLFAVGTALARAAQAAVDDKFHLAMPASLKQQGTSA